VGELAATTAADVAAVTEEGVVSSHGGWKS